MHSSFAFAGNFEALFGRSPWSFIRRFIARVLGAFRTNPLTSTNFGAYDSEATACHMNASVQSPVELQSVDARSSAPPICGARGHATIDIGEVFHEFLVLRSTIISKRVSPGEVFLERKTKPSWKVVYRETKQKFIRTKESGAADTCLKQDRMRCRDGVSRTKSSSYTTANPRERTSSSARVEQRTTGIYIRVAARDALSGEPVTCGRGKEAAWKETPDKIRQALYKMYNLTVLRYQRIRKKKWRHWTAPPGILHKVKRNVPFFKAIRRDTAISICKQRITYLLCC